MFYVDDFRMSKNYQTFINNKPSENKFSVIISNKAKKKKCSQYSLIVAAKPFVYFTSLFGSKLVSYKRDDVVGINLINKIYALLIIITHILLSMIILKPQSWHYTKTDVPLNILTKTYGMLNSGEAVYSVFAIAICNTKDHVELFHKLDEIDSDFQVSQAVFWRRRLLSILLAILPIIQVLCTFWLRKFNIQNISAHMTFFLIMVQGSILYFCIVNIYLKLRTLNLLLVKKIKKTMSKRKEIIFQDTICDLIMRTVCMEPVLIHEKVIDSCWFELMQIYDKLADCVHLFNKIYCGQVFAMYNTWLLCTMLLICRSLSPSVKNSGLFLSDLFLYLCINSRPIVLACMCEMFMRERKKTLALLLHVLLPAEKENQYFSQVKTMIMLVVSRKLEISANVFTVNVPTVMNFAGRIISYTVLMIQYFYSHVVLQ